MPSVDYECLIKVFPAHCNEQKNGKRKKIGAS